MQSAILGIALDLLERAWMPRTTLQTPFRWENDAWRDGFMRVDESNREALARGGRSVAVFRPQQRRTNDP